MITNLRGIGAPSAFAIGVLLLLVAGPAAAHVRIAPDSTAPGYTTFTFWLYHGCGDAATTSFTVKIPQGFVDVAPLVKAGWTIEPITSVYPQPVKVYGRTVRKGFTEITWSGGDVPSHFMDNFILSGFVTGGSAERLQFITVQRCRGVAESQEVTSTVQVVRPKGAEDVRPGSKGGTSEPLP